MSAKHFSAYKQYKLNLNRIVLTIFPVPVHLYSIVTDQELQIHKDCAQTVQLISQPEVSKSYMMEGGCHDAELKQYFW